MEVEVDEKQMARPLITLLSMAYKSSSPGSPITVKLTQLGHKAILTVRYRGSAPALGMQFYLARKIVEQHGGRLEVHSAPENETTYIIMLPQRIDRAEEPTARVKQTQDTQALWTVTT